MEEKEFFEKLKEDQNKAFKQLSEAFSAWIESKEHKDMIENLRRLGAFKTPKNYKTDPNQL